MKSLASLCVQQIATRLHQLVDGGQPFSDGFLARAAQLPVCLRQQLVESLNASGHLNDRLLHTLTTAPFVSLALPRNTLVTLPTLIECIKNCSQLEAFDWSYRSLSPELIEALCEEPRASSLRELKLSCTGLTTHDLRRITSTCRRLESLDVSGNQELTAGVFDLCGTSHAACCDEYNLLASSLLGVKAELPLLGPRRKRKRDDCDDETLAYIVKRVKVDDDIVMEGTDIDLGLAEATPYSPGSVVPPRPHMSTLKITGCTKLGNDSIAQISTLFPLLQHFDCAGCPAITDIAPVLQKCGQLRSLNLSDTSVGQDSHTLPVLSKFRLKHLEVLRFSGSGSLSAPFSSWLQSCRSKLRVLELRNKYIVDLVGFNEHLAKAKRLELLDLYDTNADVRTTESLCTSKLAHLDVTNCTAVTLESLASMATPGIPTLTHLALSGVHNGCGVAMAQIGSKCPNLQLLSIGSVRNGVLKQQDIGRMLRSFTKIKDLEIWCCEFVTYRLAAAIPQLCPQIKSVLLSAVGEEGKEPNRSCVTMHELGQLETHFPRVQFRLWQHCSRGNRFFQSTAGALEAAAPLTNQLRIEVTEAVAPHHHHDGHDHAPAESQLLTRLFVDGLPLWSSEKAVSFAQLKAFTTTNYGALPVVEDWCCECNIDEFNGVLFHADPYDPSGSLVCVIREPGPKIQFRFARSQLTTAVLEAEARFNELSPRV